MFTLTLGYLIIPFTVQHSIKLLPEQQAGWTLNDTLCISYFVKTPPNIFPTIEKHIIRIVDDTHLQETGHLLSKSLQQEGCHGIIELTENKMGVLTATKQTDLFILQIIQYEKTEPCIHSSVPEIQSSLTPIEIMELCQLWPESRRSLIKLAQDIYKIASLYGYWDHWRVFEGICNRYQINSQQLMTEAV
ncbi:hypothetical protein BDB01DRAFT_772717 [Pilobolus umbonatus]|nr:hypothetical protein BDB01DRAFT_772717 [Pilobolus umbonatus]